MFLWLFVSFNKNLSFVLLTSKLMMTKSLKKKQNFFLISYINEFVLAYNGDVVEMVRFNFNGVFLNENARDTLSRVRA